MEPRQKFLNRNGLFKGEGKAEEMISVSHGRIRSRYISIPPPAKDLWLPMELEDIFTLFASRLSAEPRSDVHTLGLNYQMSPFS